MDQIQTVDRDKFKDKITEIDIKLMEEVENKVHFGFKKLKKLC